MKCFPNRWAALTRIQSASSKDVKISVTRHLQELSKMPMETLLEQRYQKFRRVGSFAGEDDSS